MNRIDAGTIRETVTFDAFERRTGPLTVNVVMVPPRGEGRGYGHLRDGLCVEFTAARKTMLQLFHRLREAGKQPSAPALEIDAAGVNGVRRIERSECPIHMLPEIPPGTAVAFAPY